MSTNFDDPATAPLPPGKQRCPVNGKAYRSVSWTTIRHHLKTPWQWDDGAEAYYFCDDPHCAVVYFGKDGSTIEKSDLRTAVGQKEKSDSSYVCYCFGITRRDARHNPEARDFVVKSTQKKSCACRLFNPSGRCCLKNFPKN